MPSNSKAPTVNKLLEAVLLNIGAIDSINLNTGKLGLSLCLFEMARCLDNESLEEIAFELLKEVLALRHKKRRAKSMEIGFVLLYLIEYKFIDADFDDLFSEDIERLISGIRASAPNSMQELVFIPFLVLFWNLKKENNIYQLASDILYDVSMSLEKLFSKVQNERFIPTSHILINSFRYYLNFASLLPDYTIPHSLLISYFTLYNQGKIPNCFSTGFLLEKQGAKDYIETMQEKGVQNIYPNILTLAQRIDLLYLLNQTKDKRYEKQILLLEKDLFDFNNPHYEKDLIQSIPANSLIAGYGFGIARLLLYWVYKENKRKDEDCSRFKYLF